MMTSVGASPGCEIDLSTAAVSRARDRGLPLELGSIATLGDQPGVLDALTLWDLVEHLLQPLEALRAVRGLLSERRGLLFCAVPNFGFQQVKVACGRMLEQLSGRPNAFTTVVPRVHLIHFTPATLRGLLVRAGFQPLLIRPGPQSAPKRKVSYLALKRATKLLLREGSEICFAATGRVVGQEIVAVAKAG